MLAVKNELLKVVSFLKESEIMFSVLSKTINASEMHLVLQIITY